jgi:hypothetical protein
MLIRRSIAALKRTARARPASYVESVLASAERAEKGHYWIDLASYLDICRQHGTFKGTPPAIDRLAVAPGIHDAVPIPEREAPPAREGVAPQPTPEPDAEAQAAAEAVVARLAEIKRRFAICKACEHSRDDGFACALHTGCCFGRFRSDLANRCPTGRW